MITTALVVCATKASKLKITHHVMASLEAIGDALPSVAFSDVSIFTRGKIIVNESITEKLALRIITVYKSLKIFVAILSSTMRE